jgi:magnesium-protoporphyrin O-methyltransferase
MNCQCQGIEELFNQKNASRELARYRSKGPDKTTRLMVEALKAQGIQGFTLLDIGGGIGAIEHELLAAGAASATDVDASADYIQAARAEAQRRGIAEQVRFQHGNFVDLAPQIPPADIVTLDRVICCYHDMAQLVSLSAGRARQLYGVVYPRDTWWVKVGLVVLNLFYRLQGTPFRVFVHPTRAVEDLLNRSGLQRRFYHRTLVWQVAVYAR